MDELISYNPHDGSELGRVALATREAYDRIIRRSQAGFGKRRLVPAPKRGDLVREIANELRGHKARLAALVSSEMGTILAEAEGEVQEMIDIADFAVGLSRQLYGLTMHSERPG